MSIRTITVIFCLFIPLFLSGCSGTVVKPPIETSEQDNKLPFILSIQDEVFDGTVLFIKGILTRNDNFSEDIPANTPLVVRLKTVKNGQPLGESMLPFAPVDTIFTLSADAVGFTDYQLDLLWGQESLSLLKAIPPQQFVTVEEVHLTAPDQSGKRFIEGVLVNKGVQILTQIDLNLQFIFVKSGEFLDLQTLNPENDTLISVPGISVPPQESRPFSIEVESELPSQGVSGDWQVVVRVKQHETK